MGIYKALNTTRAMRRVRTDPIPESVQTKLLDADIRAPTGGNAQAFDQADPTGSSIFPAVWNAMLSARAEGVGSVLTSVLLFRWKNVVEILGVPVDEGWRLSCCVTLGYPTGRWGVAQRRPAHEISYRNGWGQPLGLEISSPVWP